jgi:hypothetical protein
LKPLSEFLTLRSNVAFSAALLLAVLPLWLTDYLPLVDVPQQAAQIATLHELLRGNAFYTAEFSINWFTPYLTGDALLFLFSSILPMMTATKVVLSLAVIGVPWMTGVLLREIGGDERLRWLAIPGAYSVGLYWGFIVYVIAVPIALGLLLLTIRFEREPNWRKGLGIAAYSVLLLFSHIMALGFAALLSLSYIAARNLATPKRGATLALPYTAPLPLIALWMTRVLEADAAVQNAPTVHGGLRAHLATLFAQLSGLDATTFLINLVVASFVLLGPMIAGLKPSRAPERWLPLGVGLCVYFAFPSFAQNTAFLYERLAVFIAPLWLMAWDRAPQPSRRLAGIALVTLAVWSGITLTRFAILGEVRSTFDTVLKTIEPGKRLASLPLDNATPAFANPVLLHYGAWYQALYGGITDMSFATTHPSIVRYRDQQRPRVGERVAANPLSFEWTRDGGDTYDYYLVCASEDVAELIFKDRVTSVELVAKQGPWWLYRNRERFQAISSTVEEGALSGDAVRSLSN